MKGSYEFFITPDSKEQLHDIPGLRLTFQTDGEENVTDNNDTTTSYDFQIMGNNQIFSVIQAFLGVKWEELFDNAHTKKPCTSRLYYEADCSQYKLSNYRSIKYYIHSGTHIGLIHCCS